jgi:hypothetical protein
MSAKAMEMGQLLGSSIASAIAGDSSKLIAIGKLIAELIGNIINATLEQVIMQPTSGFVKILDSMENSIRGATGLDKIIGQSNLGQRAQSIADTTAYYAFRNAVDSFKEGVQNLRAGSTTMTAAGGDQFRPAMAGERSVFSDALGNKLVPILEKIANNTQPTPFPAK